MFGRIAATTFSAGRAVLTLAVYLAIWAHRFATGLPCRAGSPADDAMLAPLRVAVGMGCGSRPSGRASLARAGAARRPSVALTRGADLPGPGAGGVLERPPPVCVATVDFRHGDSGGGDPVCWLHRTRGRRRHLSRPGTEVNAGRDGLVADVSHVRRMPRPAGAECLKNEIPARAVLRNSVPLADPDPTPRRRDPTGSGLRGPHRCRNDRNSVPLRPQRRARRVRTR